MDWEFRCAGSYSFRVVTMRSTANGMINFWIRFITAPCIFLGVALCALVRFRLGSFGITTRPKQGTGATTRKSTTGLHQDEQNKERVLRKSETDKHRQRETEREGEREREENE